jgi:nitroreductase
MEVQMNEILTAIEHRRSVRRYKPDQIQDDDIEAIIRAGLFAPSAGNQQPWHFTVISDGEKLDTLNVRVKEKLVTSENDYVRGYGKMGKFHVFYSAPTVILVSYDVSAMAPVADSSAAIQNMLIAAESLGLGSCWVGMVSAYFVDSSHNIEFGIPEGFQPRYAVCLGYPEGERIKAPERRVGTVNYIK